MELSADSIVSMDLIIFRYSINLFMLTATKRILTTSVKSFRYFGKYVQEKCELFKIVC